LLKTKKKENFTSNIKVLIRKIIIRINFKQFLTFYSIFCLYPPPRNCSVGLDREIGMRLGGAWDEFWKEGENFSDPYKKTYIGYEILTKFYKISQECFRYK
jgi:hypothetical protein